MNTQNIELEENKTNNRKEFHPVENYALAEQRSKKASETLGIIGLLFLIAVFIIFIAFFIFTF